MANTVLIYDGQCAYCRGCARLVRALDLRKKFFVLPFESEQAQGLLRAQFGDDFGFAMFLFEGDTVSWGQEAAQRIVRGLGLAGARLAFWIYPYIVRFVLWATRRTQTVCGPGCAWTYETTQTLPLKPEVRPYVQKLVHLSRDRL